MVDTDEPKLRVRAKLTLRNDKMMCARKVLGLSQIKAAALAGVSTAVYQQLESFDFTVAVHPARALQLIEAVAGALALTVDDIAPEHLRGRKLQSFYQSVREVACGTLLELGEKLQLPVQEDIQYYNSAMVEGALSRALGSLPDRERLILQMRYGLKPYKRTHTLAEIGKKVHLNGERVRQVEDKAIRKLQHPSRAKLLKGEIEWKGQGAERDQ